MKQRRVSASTRASRGPKRSLPHLPLFSADGECPLASEPSSCHTRGTDCRGRAPKARVHQIRKRGISIISRLPMFAARPPRVHVLLDIQPSGAAGAKINGPAHSFAARPSADEDAAGLLSHQPVRSSPAQGAKSIHHTHSLTRSLCHPSPPAHPLFLPRPRPRPLRPQLAFLPPLQPPRAPPLPLRLLLAGGARASIARASSSSRSGS